MIKRNTRRGFTLIELLVVVLIIGVLAAVALPQYQSVVEKARMMEAVLNVRDIALAHQIYYLTNGEYVGPNDMNKLDVTIPGILNNGRIQTRDFIYSPNGTMVGGIATRLALAWRIKKGNEGKVELYKIYIDQEDPGRIRCSDDNRGNASAMPLKLCSKLDEKGTL